MEPNITIRHPRVPSCGHKFVPGSEPRHRNCEACWFAFFQVHGELSQSCDKVFSEFGEPGLRQLRGPKFAKNFLKFMSTLALWKKTADEAKASGKETNGQSINGPSSSDEPDPTLSSPEGYDLPTVSDFI